MRTIRYIAIGLFFAVTFSAPTMAQPGTLGKIVVINSFAFGDEKAGINKLVAASNQLNSEFTPVQTELQTMNTRLQAVSKEVQTLQANPAADRRVIQTKIDEGDSRGVSRPCSDR